MHILTILPEPELSAFPFERLAEQFDGVTVEKASSIEAVTGRGEAELLLTIGSVLGDKAGALFGAMPKLRWIQSIGTGVDNLLGHPDLANEVVVTNARGLHGAQMSEAVIAAMLALARDLPRAFRQQQAATWQRYAPRLLDGGTVGILGTGAIASSLAPRLKALGMTVVGISASPRALPDFDRVEPRADLERIAATLDHLVLLAPYAPETHHIVSRAVLAAMKPTAFLVNFARGGVVDESALLAALDARAIAGAALDVFAREPLGPESPLWAHPRVIVTPHIGGYHAAYPEQLFALIADNVARYRQGGVEALNNRCFQDSPDG